MKALVLSSGGLDSTTCIGVAIDRYGKENVSSVSFIYGQRHNKELECAKKIADFYQIKHHVLNISDIFSMSNSAMLKQSSQGVPHTSYEEQLVGLQGKPVTTYVPFRNGLMLAASASLAYSIYENMDDQIFVYIGAHADDAAGNAYPDTSMDFVQAMNKAISLGTNGKVKVAAPFASMNKAGVVEWGHRLGVPYGLTWSCYEGGDRACGVCGTCRDRLAAFRQNGLVDPIKYENR